VQSHGETTLLPFLESQVVQTSFMNGSPFIIHSSSNGNTYSSIVPKPDNFLPLVHRGVDRRLSCNYTTPTVQNLASVFTVTRCIRRFRSWCHELLQKHQKSQNRSTSEPSRQTVTFDRHPPPWVVGESLYPPNRQNNGNISPVSHLQTPSRGVAHQYHRGPKPIGIR
jgi:hypothetical protein